MVHLVDRNIHVIVAAVCVGCENAEQTDLEKMDFALKLVLDLIKENPIPKVPAHELQIALH